MGRAIAAVPEDAAAYTGREAAFWVAAEILWDDESLDGRCRDWGRAALADVQPFAITGRYATTSRRRETTSRVYAGLLLFHRSLPLPGFSCPRLLALALASYLVARW